MPNEELTKCEKLLIRAMMKLGATEDEIVGMMLLLKTKEEQMEMLHWLFLNRTATPQEMKQTSLDISLGKN